MKTLHLTYLDGTEADLPVFCQGLVPGLAIVRDDDCGSKGDYGCPYGIVHVESSSYLKPCFRKLSTARKALLAIKDLAPWAKSRDELTADYRVSYVPSAAVLREHRAAEKAADHPKKE